MATLTIELPPHAAQTEINRRRWNEVLANPDLRRVEGRVETDRYGHALVSPPPAPKHGRFQLRIGTLLDQLLPDGRALTKCPISTADGVRAADVAWASEERFREFRDEVFFAKAPEICVEVLSPGNTDAEIREKAALYFNAGAKEFWICSESGGMTFFGTDETEPRDASRLCPDFPKSIDLR